MYTIRRSIVWNSNISYYCYVRQVTYCQGFSQAYQGCQLILPAFEQDEIIGKTFQMPISFAYNLKVALDTRVTL